MRPLSGIFQMPCRATTGNRSEAGGTPRSPPVSGMPSEVCRPVARLADAARSAPIPDPSRRLHTFRSTAHSRRGWPPSTSSDPPSSLARNNGESDRRRSLNRHPEPSRTGSKVGTIGRHSRRGGFLSFPSLDSRPPRKQRRPRRHRYFRVRTRPRFQRRFRSCLWFGHIGRSITLHLRRSQESTRLKRGPVSCKGWSARLRRRLAVAIIPSFRPRQRRADRSGAEKNDCALQTDRAL